jgi:hypothetical protein
VCGEVVVVANAVRIWVNGASSVRTVCGNAHAEQCAGGGVPAACVAAARSGMTVSDSRQASMER